MITIARNLHNKLLPLIRYHCSYKNALINATPKKEAENRLTLKENIWRTPDPTHLVHFSLSRNQPKLI